MTKETKRLLLPESLVQRILCDMHCSTRYFSAAVSRKSKVYAQSKQQKLLQQIWLPREKYNKKRSVSYSHRSVQQRSNSAHCQYSTCRINWVDVYYKEVWVSILLHHSSVNSAGKRSHENKRLMIAAQQARPRIEYICSYQAGRWPWRWWKTPKMRMLVRTHTS